MPEVGVIVVGAGNAVLAAAVSAQEQGADTGVATQDADGFRDITARAVVLGCGGFEANPEWRARYLGRLRDDAKVRGTRYNDRSAATVSRA